MSFQLVIAEKPSVARSIAAVIGATEKQNGYWQGSGYLVSWCIGHLVSFAEAGQYDEKYCKWRYEDLPILPQPWRFIVPDEKKQQFEIVRALLNRPDVDSVTAATDAGQCQDFDCYRCRTVRLGDLRERKKRPHLVENQIQNHLRSNSNETKSVFRP